MAAAIEEEYQIQPQLIAGSGGVFDVLADEKLIFSKKQVGRFPEHEEVLAALDAAAP